MTAAGTVSVVIPAYNCADFVGAAIESVLTQTHPALEIIAINDGSTDGTEGVLKSFGTRVRALSQPNRGMSAARNRGCELANGEWVAFLDADDTWLPEKLEKQLRAGEDPEVGLVYTNRYNIGAKGDLPDVQSEIEPMCSGDVFLHLLTIGNNITASSVLVRRSIVRDFGGFEQSIRGTEDWDLWIRIAATWKIAACPEPLVCYRFHGGMISGDPTRMVSARDRVIERALASERGQQLPSRVRRRIIATTARANAVNAAKSGHSRIALSQFAKSLRVNPLSSTWYDLARFVTGRYRS
jgi:glycosyltransferase involved in cell wall biosynthesis